MPLTIEEKTRVDLLAAQIRQAVAPLVAALPGPSGLPLFIVHGNGAVYDQRGNLLKESPQTVPAVKP